jgi:ABC-type nitrate/sulfonate/bicarbonate transport system permease component
VRERVLQGTSIVLLVLAWAAIAALAGTAVMPGPLDVVPDFFMLLTTWRFVDPLLSSLGRVTAGFALGFVLGLAYGIVAARSDRFANASSLLFLGALFAPTLVVIFVGLMLLGVSNLAVTLITGLIVFPAIGVYIRDVVRDLDEDLLRMAQSFKVKAADKVRGIYLPYLIPPMLSAGRTGYSHAWKIVVLAEVFGLPGGLGFEIRRAYSVFNLPRLLAWLIIFILALLLIEQALRIAERRIVKWQ